jgi:hypothetical protein
MGNMKNKQKYAPHCPTNLEANNEDKETRNILLVKKKKPKVQSALATST